LKANHRNVQPVRPPAAYIGGKRNLAARLVPMLAEIPHRIYAEPFIGMGGVFFKRETAAPSEVINDASRDVATLFRILQRHYPQFLETLKFQLTTRTEFERLTRAVPDTLTDLERAARFLYLQRTTFGGKVAGRSFGVSIGTPARFDTTKLGPVLEALHERLAGVVIECLPWQDFIDRYDRPETLFYLDPPYHGCETDYGAELFGRDQFEPMAERLARIKGRFVLSVNDVPETRRIFARFEISRVKTTYSISGHAGGLNRKDAAAELIVTGGGG